VDEDELSRMLYDGGFVGSLGGIKPYCEKIKYSPLTEEEKYSTYELVKLTEDFAQSFPAFDFTNPKKCIGFNPKASFKCAYPTPVLSFLAEYSLQNTSEAQLRSVYSKDTDEVLVALKYFSRSFSAYPKTDRGSPSPKVFGPVSMWGLCPDEIKSSSVAPVYDDYEAWISPYTLDEYIGAMQKALFHLSMGLTVLRNIENPTPAADELLDIAFAAHVHLEADLYHTHYAYMKRELDEYARRLWSLARFQGRAIRGLINTQECDARLGYDPENHYLYTPNILKEKLINLEGLRKRLEVRLNEKTASDM